MRHTMQDLEFGDKAEKRGKLETHTVDPGVWRESMKNVEYGKGNDQDKQYGEKHWKIGK